jgi:DNA-binding MarR family transcriptional regulator
MIFNEGQRKRQLYHLFLYISKQTFNQTHTQLEKIDLYRGQPPLLFALWEKDGRSRKELCNLLTLKPATITKMIKRLEKTGFVFSKQDEEDSRVSRVYLTEKGNKIQEEVKQIYAELEKQTFRDFTDEERSTLTILLKKMEKNINGNELN